MDNKPIAVVVGSGLNALGVIRSLAVAKIPVQLVCSEMDAAVYTRYAKKQFVEDTCGDALIAVLIKIGQQYKEKPVLFLTEEKSVVTVSERRDEILPYFRIAVPDQVVLSALMHKQGFQDIASKLGSPVPPAVHLRSEADLPELDKLRYPCVLKPAVKDYAYGARFQKAYVVSSIEEASARFREIAPICTDLVVQQWIEGSDDDIYFCLQYVGGDGPVASFCGRKLRSWPPYIGGTASCTAAWEVADELNELTTAFFKATGFSGMGSMEYKRDRRDGRFYMIEPTVARTDFQEEVATLNGVNIPLVAYCHETGQPLPPIERPLRDRAWQEPLIDRWSAERQPGRPPRGMEGIVVIDAYFRWSDPRPWVQWMGWRLAQFWQSIAARLKGRSGA